MMRAIIVDDERLMIHKFMRLTEDIEDFTVVGEFENSEDAVKYVEKHPVEAAFLDVEIPEINGLELAKILRSIRKDILIVFISAYEDYVRDSNELGGDYYIVKPYTKEILVNVIGKMRLLSARQHKDVYIRTF